MSLVTTSKKFPGKAIDMVESAFNNNAQLTSMYDIDLTCDIGLIPCLHRVHPDHYYSV